jgi:hypothetical protein
VRHRAHRSAETRDSLARISRVVVFHEKSRTIAPSKHRPIVVSELYLISDARTSQCTSVVIHKSQDLIPISDADVISTCSSATRPLGRDAKPAR